MTAIITATFTAGCVIHVLQNAAEKLIITYIMKTVSLNFTQTSTELVNLLKLHYK